MIIESKGKNGIAARLLRDSISESGDRICTFEVEVHRFVWAEFLTHRMFSKNAASSRAIPIQTVIDMVTKSPAIPISFGKNRPGMQATEELTGVKLDTAKMYWELSAAYAADYAGKLSEVGVHKQISNRVLDSFVMMKAVVTMTDFDNFEWLRDDIEAQPEIQELAKMMVACRNGSFPIRLKKGEWHLPYVDIYRDESDILHYLDSDSGELSLEDAQKISASCCAQISFRRLNDTKEKALEIYSKLFSGRKPHMSPCEHQATPICMEIDVEQEKNVPYLPQTWEDGVTHVDRKGRLHSGNFTGWIQYRQVLPNNVFVKE
jgi:hypothetical protein